jgi:hypothetical protein
MQGAWREGRRTISSAPLRARMARKFAGTEIRPFFASNVPPKVPAKPDIAH